MIVRAASETDLPAILDIYNEAALNTTATADTTPQKLDARREWYEHRRKLGLPVLVAEEDGRVVGWSSLSPYSNRAGYRFTAEDSIYVAADSRGVGVGKALLGPLIEAARDAELHLLVAKIDSANQVSIHLHERFGFEGVGVLREAIFKFDRWLDVTYMQMLINGGEADGED